VVGTAPLCLAVAMLKGGKKDEMLDDARQGLYEVLVTSYDQIKSVTPDLCHILCADPPDHVDFRFTWLCIDLTRGIGIGACVRCSSPATTRSSQWHHVLQFVMIQIRRAAPSDDCPVVSEEKGPVLSDNCRLSKSFAASDDCPLVSCARVTGGRGPSRRWASAGSWWCSTSSTCSRAPRPR
jgi:hypothetical protein